MNTPKLIPVRTKVNAGTDLYGKEIRRRIMLGDGGQIVVIFMFPGTYAFLHSSMPSYPPRAIAAVSDDPGRAIQVELNIEDLTEFIHRMVQLNARQLSRKQDEWGGRLWAGREPKLEYQ